MRTKEKTDEEPKGRWKDIAKPKTEKLFLKMIQQQKKNLIYPYLQKKFQLSEKKTTPKLCLNAKIS